MDVRPIMPVPAAGAVERVAPIMPGMPRPESLLPDILDSASLPEFSASDLGRLAGILEPPGGAQQAATFQEALRGAVTAAQAGDLAGAVERMAQAVKLNPARAETVTAEPGLAPVRNELDRVLTRMASIAALDARGRLSEAAGALEAREPRPLPGWDTPPQVLLATANRLCDAGGYANCCYSIALAQVVIEGAPLPVGTARNRSTDQVEPAAARKAGEWLRDLWLRAPLLILLAVWFLLGLAVAAAMSLLHSLNPEQFPASIVDSDFTVWGMGFLALILFGFYLRVRRIRFR